MDHFDWSTNPASITILVITLIFSVIGLMNERFKVNCMLHPYSIVRNKKLYTILTSGLVHANIGHLVFNMLTFYFFAFALERGYLGTTHFTILYLSGLLLCDIPTIIKNRDNINYYSLGASGAISAVLFCMIMYQPNLGIGIMFIPIPIPGYVFGVLYLIYTSYSSTRQAGNINHDAHLYGALTGIILAFVLNFDEASQVIEKIMRHRPF